MVFGETEMVFEVRKWVWVVFWVRKWFLQVFFNTLHFQDFLPFFQNKVVKMTLIHVIFSCFYKKLKVSAFSNDFAYDFVELGFFSIQAGLSGS